MEPINITMDASDRSRGYLFRRFPLSVGPEIDKAKDFVITGPPLPSPPTIICSTEQTTAFTAYAYNVRTSSFSILVHRMDQGPAPGGILLSHSS